MPRLFASCLSLSFVISTLGCAGATASPDPELRAVSEALTDYRRAWLANDEQRVMARVADDFMLFPPGAGSKTVVGKAAIKTFWFPASDTVYRITRYDVRDQQLVVDGNLAVEQGTSVLEWDTVARGTTLGSASSTNEYLTVLRKDADGWKLSRSMHVPR